jgi:hypothetical protein
MQKSRQKQIRMNYTVQENAKKSYSAGRFTHTASYTMDIWGCVGKAAEAI